MVSVVVDGIACTFTYNDEGLRTSKTVNGVTTVYYYSGNTLIAEQSPTQTIIYIYDANGLPIGMQCRLNTYAKDVWDLYWYDKNLQGDIVGVYNSSGTKLITYRYDAWGDPYITYHSGNASSLYAKNPFMYRGYYYDKDLGLYYLQTRYYDPLNCRFISPDAASVITATPTGLTDKNLYAYCDNNPVTRVDRGGEFWNYIVGGVVGAVAGGVIEAINGGDVIDVIIGVAGGAASGVVSASGLGWVAQAGVSAAISATSNVVGQAVDIVNDGGTIANYDIAETALEAALGFGTSALGSWLGSLAGKHITKTSKIADQAFDNYLGKLFSAGLRSNAGHSSSALLRQANKFLGKSMLFDNVTRAVSSVIGSIVSLWNIVR